MEQPSSTLDVPHSSWVRPYGLILACFPPYSQLFLNLFAYTSIKPPYRANGLLRRTVKENEYDSRMATNCSDFGWIGGKCRLSERPDEGFSDGRAVARDLSHDACGWLEDLQAIHMRRV